MSTPAPAPAAASGGRGGGRGGRRRGGGGGGRGRGGSGGGSGGGRSGGSGSNKANSDTAAGRGSEAKAPLPRGGGKPGREGRGTEGRGADGRGADGRGAEGASKSRNRKRGTKKPAAGPSTPSLSPDEERARREEVAAASAAEEAKRQQEAAAAAEAAAAKKRKQQQETLDLAVTVATETLKIAADGAQLHAQNRQQLSPDALAAARKDFEANKKTLKTDLKKCTAFVKKLKSGTAWTGRPADVEKDVATLNLSRYVDEVVAAVFEGKPKVADLPVVVALSGAMHRRYPEFLQNLMPKIWFMIQSDDAKARRQYLRLLTEFVLNGLVPSSSDVKSLVKCLTEATGANNNYAVSDANMIVAFCKTAGFEILGVQSRSVTDARKLVGTHMDSPSSDEDSNKLSVSADVLLMASTAVSSLQNVSAQRAIPEASSEILLTHCLGAYKMLTTSLVQTHGKLVKLEKRCDQDRILSGSLPEAREKGLADARKLKESLEKSVEALSDALNQPMPHLHEEEDDEDAETGGIEVWTKGGEADFGPFDDQETRDFYCDIPDYLTTIPPALLNLSPEDIEKRKAENAKKYGEDAVVSVDDEVGTLDEAITSEEQLEASEAEESKLESENVELEGDAEAGNKDTPHYKLMVLLDEELPECHRKEEVDDITERFCTNHGSNKNSRKRLLKTIFLVPRTRLDLLPLYSRVAATLDRVWTDFGPPLVADLEQQFHGQAKFKKNQNIDSRMKTARFIGELTKFRVAPPMVALRSLHRCVEDFTGNNVDVACCLLESCGRFLFRMKHTNPRLASIMETMTRLSKAKNLDERLQSLLKASFYSVNPPPSGPKKGAKEYPPMEAYMRHLLLSRLEPGDSSVSLVTKQIVRLPWHDPSQQCGELVCKIMLKGCRRGRYRTIKAIATVAANVRTQKTAGEVTIRLIDAVLEELLWAIESPNFRDQQRALTYARLLGELYCTSQVSLQVIVQHLYAFINTGHNIPTALREASTKLALAEEARESNPEIQLPVYNSAGGVAQTIGEDEEMEESELETKDETKVPAETQPVAVSQYSQFDPRVSSLTDPPNSAFRVKLVCTLLDVVAKVIVTRNNMPRVSGFLTAFQRYLFTKSVLPTDVEFNLLDVFDVLDSQWRRIKGGEAGFPRYPTWLEAHNATIAIEETDAVLQTQKVARLTTQLDDANMDLDFAEDESAGSEEEDDASASQSANLSVVDDHHQDEMEPGHDGEEDEDMNFSGSEDEEEDDEESDFESEDEEDVEDEEEFDEEEYMRQMEEDAFDRELRRITADAIERGKNASRKQVADNMISGSQIVKKKPGEKAATQTSEPSGAPPVFALGGGAGVSFQLLKKSNKGKVEAKELVVPADSNLALAANKQDDEAARERDVIKQRVLQYEAESAEAEFSNVYLEQEKLQVIRNRPLSMDDIDRNFGTRGGNRHGTNKGASQPSASGRGGAGPSRGPQGRGRGGRGRGRSSASGRSLF